VLFGSGMTENNPFMQKGAVLDAEIRDWEKELVLYENARRFFSI
jgi:predicted TIM-barrel fold metal-dependent hydrolase